MIYTSDGINKYSIKKFHDSTNLFMDKTGHLQLRNYMWLPEDANSHVFVDDIVIMVVKMI